MQADQHFGHLVADAVAFLLEQIGGLGQMSGNGLKALQYVLDALLGGAHRLAVLVGTAGRRLDQLRDGVVDDIDLGRHLLAGLAGLARQAAHRIGDHRK
ncbi:hypothetical protein APX70_03365, partial [Pseudomonas syringae pv. maculicola]